MLLFVFILTFVSYVVSTTTEKSLELRIVGGQDINITEAPYQVVMSFKNYSCGGVIIADNLVLTTAHCVDGMSPEMYKVRAGSSYKHTGGQIYSVSDIIKHPDYMVAAYSDCDIAILRLSTPLTFSDSVASIPMMSANEEVPDGELTVITGWGSIFEGGSFPPILQRVAVPKVNDKQCFADYQKYNRTITSNMFCAGFPEGGKDACLGDSGGPMVYNKKLAGIISWSNGCARPGYPGVYSKISALRPWIDKNIAQLNKNSS